METRTLTKIIIAVLVGIVAAGAMNYFLNILVKGKEAAPITQEQTWKKADAGVEQYFKEELPEAIKQRFSRWTLYDFTALAAAILLIIVGLFFTKEIAIGLFAAGVLLLILRFQTTSTSTNLAMLAIGAIITFIFGFLILRKK